MDLAWDLAAQALANPDAPSHSKWLEHLKEVARALTRAMVLLNPDIAANFEFYRAAQAAGTAFRLNVDAVHVRGAADIQRAVSALAGEPHAGVIVLPSPVSAVIAR
jgi:putative ABC transport system substrate-binding protein